MLTCTFCNKEYKTFQSRSNHIRIYHINDIPQNTTKIVVTPQIYHKIPQNISNVNTCKYCSKTLSRYDSARRHETICKNNNSKNFLEENNELL
jgi:hypothetical protein